MRASEIRERKELSKHIWKLKRSGRFLIKALLTVTSQCDGKLQELPQFINREVLQKKSN